MDFRKDLQVLKAWYFSSIRNTSRHFADVTNRDDTFVFFLFKFTFLLTVLRLTDN